MRVLAIGNSFSQDATRYLYQIARADGKDMAVANLYISGCPLERHFRNMLSDSRDYILGYNGVSTGFYVSLKEVLLNRSWDVVTLQQASALSHKPNSYDPYINELYDYVKACVPKAKIVIHQTWAYEQGSAKLANAGFEDHKEMFRQIKTAYEKAVETVKADGLIPSGEMFQYLLANGFEKIHRDTYHATRGAGRYALSLLWYRLLTGQSVTENTFCDFDEVVTDGQIAVIKDYVEKQAPLKLN